jgi:ABC-type nickel/cobalt efflux system permease component RcnA
MKKILGLIALFFTLTALSPLMAQHYRAEQRSEYRMERGDHHRHQVKKHRHGKAPKNFKHRNKRQCQAGRPHDNRDGARNGRPKNRGNRSRD